MPRRPAPREQTICTYASVGRRPLVIGGAPREQTICTYASVGRRPLVIGGTMSRTRFSFGEEQRRHRLPGAPREQTM